MSVPPITPPRKAPPLPNLTALRFLAALMVVGYHFTNNGENLGSHSPWAALVRQGFLGVPLFFVLSGFVLAYSYPTVPSRRAFYLARFARVYPMALVSFVCMLPFTVQRVAALHQHFAFGAVPLHVLLLQAWTPGYEYYVNGPEWTLSVEALFYLLFPFVLPWIVGRLDYRWFWIVTFWAVFLIQPLLASRQHLPVRLHLAPAYTRIFYVVTHYTDAPPCFLGEFLMGMFAGAQFRRRPVRVSSGWVACSVSFTLVSLYVSAALPFFVVRNSGMALVFVFLVITLAGWESSLLASKPLQLGGEISYSMYLLQMLVLGIFQRMPASLLHTWLMIPMLIGISLLSYLYIEKPARTAILRHFGVRARAKPIPTPMPIA